jgi:hypothetical protein
VPAEAGDHFVENEHRAVFFAERLHRFEKAWCGVDGARGFEKHGRDAARVRLEERAKAFGVVVVKK